MTTIDMCASCPTTIEDSIQLTLGLKEQEILTLALTNTISDLGAEIADTDNQDFRDDREERKTVLRDILKRLE